MGRSDFSLEGRNAVVIGGGGALGSAVAQGLGRAGAYVHVVDVTVEKAEACADTIRGTGGSAASHAADATDRGSLESLRDSVLEQSPAVDVLVNLAGGNIPEASTSDERTFFDLPIDAFQKAIALNLFAGAILPSQVFGRVMAGQDGGGAIVNTASMNAYRPLTRIPAYSAGKAAVANFTQWLAVHFAQEYSPRLRVNAIAPGFFLTDQNRYLLLEASGELTARGKTVVDHTPMGRLGAPEDVAGAVVWLASDAAAFVTGIVVPVDGGFSAFSGV